MRDHHRGATDAVAELANTFGVGLVAKIVSLDLQGGQRRSKLVRGLRHELLLLLDRLLVPVDQTVDGADHGEEFARHFVGHERLFRFDAAKRQRIGETRHPLNQPVQAENRGDPGDRQRGKQRHGGRGGGMIGDLHPCAVALGDLGKAMSIAASVDAPGVASDLDVGKAGIGRSGQRLRARTLVD